MLCDICKQNEATVHVTNVVNGVKKEYNICESCAKKHKGFNLIDPNFIDMGNIDISSPFSFTNVLSGLMDYMTQSTQNEIEPQLVCENCGMTYNEFKETGLLGCSECYKNFQSTLSPVIKRVQGNVEHVGKLPKKSAKGIAGKRKILKLKEDLQKAIAEEEYEEAAKIRDEIRKIQKDE